MNKLVEVIFDNQQLMRNVDGRLTMLARAAEMLGQDRLADELSAIGETLLESSKRIIDVHGEALTGELQASREHAAGILRTLIEKTAPSPARSA